jgi:hypothetical protein
MLLADDILGDLMKLVFSEVHHLRVARLAGLSGRGARRQADSVRCGPLVQNFWSEVGPAGPGDRADLGVDSHLGEERGIVQGGEHAAQFSKMGQIDVADQAVGEGQPQPVVTEDFHLGHVVEGSGHTDMLCQRRDRGWQLVRGDQRPVCQQLLLVQHGPLDDTDRHRLPAVARVKVRERMVVVVHRDHDAEEGADGLRSWFPSSRAVRIGRFRT